MKKIKVLVMSVGPYEKNGTVKWLEKIKAQDLAIVCLPKEFEENKKSYEKRNINVFIYDEKKYINEEFEYFGFKPRNCGGIGRQGIAEATEKYGDEYICFQLDDDTGGYSVKNSEINKSRNLRDKESLIELVNAFDEFYNNTKIECMGKTGATPPKGDFVSNRKIFNNFIMRKGNKLNFDGFKALCSDDYRYGFYRNLLEGVPTISADSVSISFTQTQGNRDDGNAVIYNGDYSWKKSFGLKMMFPWGAEQRLDKEGDRYIFRENLRPSICYPPICVVENGKIVGKVE